MKDKSVGVGRCQRAEIMLFAGSRVGGGTGKNAISPAVKNMTILEPEEACAAARLQTDGFLSPDCYPNDLIVSSQPMAARRLCFSISPIV